MIYLDNASTTKADEEVLKAAMPYLMELYGNAGTLYDLGRKSHDAVEKARKQVAALLHASPEQIIFTSGGSEANNMVFRGLRKHLLSVGKTHIITSKIEHDSVLNAVKEVCEYKASGNSVFDADFVSPKKNSGVYADTVESYINSNKRTGLVSIMHTNNETGIENQVSKIGSICKNRNILFHTDCVQAIGCSDIDVNEINCDFLSLSAHKIHGFKGVGALYARDRSLLSPIISGGKAQEFGLRGGTENVAGIAAFGKACELLKQSRSKDIKYIGNLRRTLYEYLKVELSRRDLPDIIRLNGDVDLEQDGKIMNIRFDGVDGETLLLMLNSKGVCVSAGSACTSRESKPSHVLTAMGISPEDARNSIRISLSKMNTEDEMRRAAGIIADSIAILHKKACF